MARKSKSVAKHKIPEIAASLKAKAAVPITISLEDTIVSLAPQIQAMLDAGYSYADVADVFKSHEVDLAASSIQSYHRKQLKSEAQAHTKPESFEGETSTVVAVDEGKSIAQMNVSSVGDKDLDESQNDLSDERLNIDDSVVAKQSLPTPNSQTAKKSSPQSTQVNSRFNVTDRSKL